MSIPDREELEFNKNQFIASRFESMPKQLLSDALAICLASLP